MEGGSFVLLTCESGFGASGRAGCKSDRRRHASAESPQPEVFRSVERLDVLDGASVDLGRLFSQPGEGSGIWMGIGPALRKEGWMVPVQDGEFWREPELRVAVSKRRAFGGCLGTRMR